jgi:hypothetical protein
VKTFEPWAVTGQNSSGPRPGLVVANGGTATCDSGSADDPGSAAAVRCSPPGDGRPCYIDDLAGASLPGFPLLCSSDPTSNQVTMVDPSDPNGIPAGMLNPGDRGQPPWFLILADGKHCRLMGYGTNTNVLSYDCGSNIGATVPDHSAPAWTVQEGRLQPYPVLSPARVAVVTAYRGKTSILPGSAPAALPGTPPPAPVSPAAPGTRACAFNTPAMWSPLCPDGPGDTHFTPWQVVYFYYAYVNAGDYPDAWALMSPGWQATQGDYDRWEAGYAGANNGHVSEISQQGDIVNVAVTLPGKCFTGDYQVDNNKITAAHVTTCT